jgi:tetratricopeptide (TPR) repeat protein
METDVAFMRQIGSTNFYMGANGVYQRIPRGKANVFRAMTLWDERLDAPGKTQARNFPKPGLKYEKIAGMAQEQLAGGRAVEALPEKKGNWDGKIEEMAPSQFVGAVTLEISLEKNGTTNALMTYYSDLCKRVALGMLPSVESAARDGNVFWNELKLQLDKEGGREDILYKDMNGNLISLFAYDISEALGIRTVEVAFGKGTVFAKAGNWVLDPKMAAAEMLDGEKHGHLSFIRGQQLLYNIYSNIGDYKYNIKQDYASALELYGAALKIDPSQSWLHNGMGCALAKLGKLDKAIAHQEKAIELETGRALLADYYYDLASARFKTGDISQTCLAKEDCSRALLLNSDAMTYVLRARITRSLHDLESALHDCDRAIESDPLHAESFKERSEIRDILGDRNGADADFAKYRELGNFQRKGNA